MASGCSRIGFIGGLGNIMGEHEYPEDVRTFAFRNWALRLGLDVQGLVYADGPFTVENGRLQGRQLVQDHADDLPDAVLVAAAPLAVGVLQAFATENVMVPRDIKVISINNQEIAKYTSPALSSYDISQDELAKAAVLMLAEALTANRKISQHMRISTSLVARIIITPQVCKQKLEIQQGPASCYEAGPAITFQQSRLNEEGGRRTRRARQPKWRD